MSNEAAVPTSPLWLRRKAMVYSVVMAGLGVPIIIFSVSGIGWKASVYWGVVLGFSLLSLAWCALVLGFPDAYVGWIRTTQRGAPEGALRFESWSTSLWGDKSDNYRGLRKFGWLSLAFAAAVVAVLVIVGVQISF